jgi:hypothetical protein
LRDRVGARLGRPPHLIAAVGDAGTFAIMTAPDAKPGFVSVVAPASPCATSVQPG